MGRETGRWPLLTARHQEVLQLIIQGMTSRQIAEELGISRRTVEVHRTNIMRRLGARNISDLFREAILRHLVPKRFWRRAAGSGLDQATPELASGDSSASTPANNTPLLA